MPVIDSSMQARELRWEAGLRNMTAAVRAEYVSLTPPGASRSRRTWPTWWSSSSPATARAS